MSQELATIESGNIGAIVGLRSTKTGDTILSAQAVQNAATAAGAKAAAAAASGVLSNGVDPRLGYLRGIRTSEPVFFCSVEAASLTAQEQLELALACLVREDPSLVVSTDPETGQTLIAGMGELHLEIVKSRLENDFQLGSAEGGARSSKVGSGGGVEFGRMRISYREGLSSTLSYERFRFTAGALTGASGLLPEGVEAEASIDLEMEPLDVGEGVDIDIEGVAQDEEDGVEVAPAIQAMRSAVEAGVRDGLSRGPLLGYPLTDVRVRVSNLVASSTASTSSIALSFRACAARCISHLLRESAGTGTTRGSAGSGVHLLEPVMNLVVQCPSDRVGEVLSDLTGQRRAQIVEVGQIASGASSSPRASSASRSFIHAEAPLSGMLGYASVLRSATQGNGSFTMHFLQFRQMPPHLQTSLISAPP